MLFKSVLLASFFAKGFTQNVDTFTPLKDSRSEIKFIPLTAKEKELTAQTMVNLFEVI